MDSYTDGLGKRGLRYRGIGGWVNEGIDGEGNERDGNGSV